MYNAGDFLFLCLLIILCLFIQNKKATAFAIASPKNRSLIHVTEPAVAGGAVDVRALRRDYAMIGKSS